MKILLLTIFYPLFLKNYLSKRAIIKKRQITTFVIRRLDSIIEVKINFVILFLENIIFFTTFFKRANGIGFIILFLKCN